MDFFGILPDEIIEKIFTEVARDGIATILRCLRVSRTWIRYLALRPQICEINHSYYSRDKIEKFEEFVDEWWRLYAPNGKINAFNVDIDRVANYKIQTQRYNDCISIKSGYMGSTIFSLFGFCDTAALFSNLESCELDMIANTGNEFMFMFSQILERTPRLNTLKLSSRGHNYIYHDRSNIQKPFLKSCIYDGQLITEITKKVINLQLEYSCWFSKSVPNMFNNLHSLSIVGFFPFTIAMEVIAVNLKLKELELKNIGIKLETVLLYSLRNRKVISIYRQLQSLKFETVRDEVLRLPESIQGFIFPNVSKAEIIGLTIGKIEFVKLFDPFKLKHTILDTNGVLKNKFSYKSCL